MRAELLPRYAGMGGTMSCCCRERVGGKVSCRWAGLLAFPRPGYVRLGGAPRNFDCSRAGSSTDLGGVELRGVELCGFFDEFLIFIGKICRKNDFT